MIEQDPPIIEYSPPKKIVIHHITKHATLQDMLKNSDPNLHTIGWCNGYMVIFTSFHGSDDIIKEALAGTTHIAGLYYCEYPEFVGTVKNSWNQEISVIDQSKESPVVAMINWIYANDKK